MVSGAKAALLAVVLAVVLYLRDARVSHMTRAHSALEAAALFAEHPASDDLFATDEAVDGDDGSFGTDDFGSADVGPANRRGAAAAGKNEFDEFNFASDYDEDDDDDDEVIVEGAEGQYSGAGGEHRLLIQFDNVQYAAQYEAVRTMLERNYPQLRGNVRGEKYPVPALTQAISTAMSFGPFLLLGLALAGGKVFDALGLPPSLLEKIQANRLYILPAFLIFNSFVGPQISKTDAFEVVYNGALVFSKLRTGVLPVDQDLPQLVAALAASGLKARNSFT